MLPDLFCRSVFLTLTKVYPDEKWRCAKATMSQLIVPSSLRLQLTVDCRTRFARLMVYNTSSVQDCATRENPHTVLYMLRVSVPSAYSGERLRSRISLASELLDGTRDSVLALKTCSPARSANSDLRTQNCGAATPHAVLHMLRVSVPSAYSGERLRSRISLASELRDGTRDSVLALNHAGSLFLCHSACSVVSNPLHMQSCTQR